MPERCVASIAKCCSQGLGGDATNKQTRNFRSGGNSLFFAFVATNALLAKTIALISCQSKSSPRLLDKTTPNC